jgi:hypothetical protein
MDRTDRIMMKPQSPGKGSPRRYRKKLTSENDDNKSNTAECFLPFEFEDYRDVRELTERQSLHLRECERCTLVINRINASPDIQDSASAYDRKKSA